MLVNVISSDSSATKVCNKKHFIKVVKVPALYNGLVTNLVPYVKNLVKS